MELEYTAVAEDATPVLSSNRTFMIMDDDMSSFGEVLDVGSVGEGETKKSVACDLFVERLSELSVSAGVDGQVDLVGSGWMRMQSETGEGLLLKGKFEEFLFESVMVDMSFDEESCSVEVSVSFFVEFDEERRSALSDSEVREGFDLSVAFMDTVLDDFGVEFCEEVLDVESVRVFA